MSDVQLLSNRLDRWVEEGGLGGLDDEEFAAVVKTSRLRDQLLKDPAAPGRDDLERDVRSLESQNISCVKICCAIIAIALTVIVVCVLAFTQGKR